MKYFFISLIFLIFLSSIKASSDDAFEMDEEYELTDGTNFVVFETETLQKGKELLVQIKADSFLDTDIFYEFFDDIDKIGENTDISSPYDTKTDNTYKSNYYRIKKELGNGIEGKYIYLYFNCTGKVTVGSTHMPSTQDKDILKKYSEISVKDSEGGFIFDSSGYNEGDKMYFKVKAKKFNKDSLYYEFWDDLLKYYPKYLYEYYDEAPSTKSETNNSYVIHYYTVEKKKGKYLIAYFVCEGTVTIKNTETDEGNKKSSKTLTIVIIVIVVIIIIGVIAYYCYRRKKNEGGFCAGNKTEVGVYNEEQINNNQNPSNIPNNNYQTINVQNNKNNKKKNNQNQTNQTNIQQNTPNYNNMNINQNNQNTLDYNNMNNNQNYQNIQNYNNMNNNQNYQNSPNYNNMNINQNYQINPNNQMYPNNANNNNQGYTSFPVNENYTSAQINAQNYDINIDSNNQLNQNGNYAQMDNNASPMMGYPYQQ